ncbi:uncharacterized protein [Euwallacea fornicatus]|uniref:uncharacterized protein n=1 Tax=Euwallacea fornicatus TaxID=995702 RepID=UPI00338FD313
MQKVAIITLICASICGTRAAENSTKPPSTNNSSLVDQVLQVIPLDKIDEIEKNHLQTDEGFKSAVLYFQSEEWKGLVEVLAKSAEFHKFADMALKFKLNISRSIESLRNHIDSLNVSVSQENVSANLSSFVRDVQKVLPIGEIAKVVVNSDGSGVRNLGLQANAKEYQKIAEDIYNLPAVEKMRQALRDMNFNVEPYIALVYTLFGWIN